MEKSKEEKGCLRLGDKNDLQKAHKNFYKDMRGIIINARDNAVRSIEFTRVPMYWHLGERIL